MKLQKAIPRGMAFCESLTVAIRGGWLEWIPGSYQSYVVGPRSPPDIHNRRNR
jgi:hypothetical protein